MTRQSLSMKGLRIPIVAGVLVGLSAHLYLSNRQTIAFAIARNNYSEGQLKSERPIEDFEISPDGSNIITIGPISSKQYGVQVWDYRTRKPTRTLAKGESEISDVIFMESGSKIATAHVNGKVNIWNFKSGELEKSYSSLDEKAGSISIMNNRYLIADNSYLEGEKKRLHVWDLQSDSSSCVLNIDGIRFSFSAHPIAEEIIGYSIIGGLRKISLKSCDVIQSYEIDVWNLEGRQYDSGSFIEFRKNGEEFISNVDNKIEIWNVKYPDPIQSLEGHKSELLTATVSPNDEMLISSSSDNTIRLWDLQGKRELSTVPANSKYLDKLQITPDGKTLLTWGENSTVQFWNIESMKNKS